MGPGYRTIHVVISTDYKTRLDFVGTFDDRKYTVNANLSGRDFTILITSPVPGYSDVKITLISPTEGDYKLKVVREGRTITTFDTTFQFHDGFNFTADFKATSQIWANIELKVI